MVDERGFAVYELKRPGPLMRAKPGGDGAFVADVSPGLNRAVSGGFGGKELDAGAESVSIRPTL